MFFSLRSQEKETHHVQERNTRKSTLRKSKYYFHKHTTYKRETRERVPYVNLNIIFIHSLRRVHRPGALSLSLSLSLSQKNNREENWPAARAAQPPSACHIGIIKMMSVCLSVCPSSIFFVLWQITDAKRSKKWAPATKYFFLPPLARKKHTINLMKNTQ